jgi:cytochrome c biogenesis protein CcmG, thiol:disulfide interchange protein DsbE
MKSSTVVIIIVLLGVVCCVLVGCVFCVATLGWYGSQANGGFNIAGVPQVGEVASDFELRTIDGERVSLSDFRGQPVMLNFWALWCGPCIEEMPLIQARYQQHYPDLVVLAIEEGGGGVSVENFVNQNQITFLILAGTDAVFRQYNVYAYPTSFFIDADGTIQSVQLGSLSASELDEKLSMIGVGE